MADNPPQLPVNPLIRQRSPSADLAAMEEQPVKKLKTDVESTLEEEEAAAGPASVSGQIITDVIMESTTTTTTTTTTSSVAQPLEAATSEKPKLLEGAMLPPSSIIYSNPDGQLGLIASEDGLYHIRESDVGIIEYLSDKTKSMEGVIKQRFTDFMVYEITPEDEILHLKDIGPPKEPKPEVVEKDEKEVKKVEEVAEMNEETAANGETVVAASVDTQKGDVKPVEIASQQETTVDATIAKEGNEPNDTAQPSTLTSTEPLPELPTELQFPAHRSWPTSATHSLLSILSTSKIIALHDLLIQGRNPPPPQRQTDGGWGSKRKNTDMTAEEAEMAGINGEDGQGTSAVPKEMVLQGWEITSQRGRGGRGGGRGARGARGGRGGRGGFGGGGEERPIDTREVLSDPIEDKTKRSEFHAKIRELFTGTFETFTRDVTDSTGSIIAIKWGAAPRPGRKGKERDQGPQGALPKKDQKPVKLPNYIHFTMQKANRDTQDCLGHLSRVLHVQDKALSTAGTKDKRGVTVQRVCLKRGGMRMSDVWRAVNGVRDKRRSFHQATHDRGERGLRIGDLAYSDEYLELGMLKGNHFTITLRNVKSASQEHIDEILTSLKTRGFINYYGMQRFGTSSIGSHTIGLALLQGDWKEATSLILERRPGEHPDGVAARDAWEKRDIEAALRLMPRRNVAERALWEFWNRPKSDLTDHYMALSNIPRNLRLIYVHAYQSYIWNVIVSERVRMSPDKALVGDLVYGDEKASDEEEGDVPRYFGNAKRDWKTSRHVAIKILTEADVDNYKLSDVVLPLPGHDIIYPSGPLYEKIKAIMAVDGLDPASMLRDQREYSLAGSYRKIVHNPKDLSWKHLRYTDPDVPLCQSDEDKILGKEAPPSEEAMNEGEFAALQISLSLGTSAYATMALRELTKMETSAHHQSHLTAASEDQKHRTGVSAEGGSDERDPARQS